MVRPGTFVIVFAISVVCAGAGISTAAAPPPAASTSANQAHEANRVNEIRRKLARAVSLENGVAANTPLQEALQFIGDRYDVSILISTETFTAVGMEAVEDTRVRLPRVIGMKLSTILHLLLDQVHGTYLIHPEYIEVLPLECTRPESWRATQCLAPTVNTEFAERPVDEALRELANESGISVVLDGRARERATMRVTATLNNVPIDTAVLVLADMADLRPVVLGNVLYITTKENAKQLTAWHKEQHKPSQASETPSVPSEPESGE